MILGTLRSADSRVRLALASIALVALLVAIYRPALDGPFVLDDIGNLPATYMDRFSLAALWTVATGNESGIFGRPVPVVTFALNYLAGGDEPTAFKITNLVLHSLNGILVLALCLTLLGRLDGADEDGARRGRVAFAALLATALWTLHPLQVSTVMYIVQRMTILMTMFSMLALLLYARVRISQIDTGAVAPYATAGVLACTLLACLSKENGALVLLYIPLIETLVFRFRTHPALGRRRFLGGLALLLVLPLALGGLIFALTGDSLLRGYELRDFDVGERLLTQPTVMLLYLKMILLPNLADMTFYHDGFPITRRLDPTALLHLGLVATLAGAVPLLARRAPVASLGIGLFLISHLLESTVLPLELVFEHRNYFGMLGLLLPIAWYASAASGRARTSVPTKFLTAVVLVLISLQTYGRSLEWSSDLSLSAFAVENRPGSSRARAALAVALGNRGRFDEAVEQLRLSAPLDPDNPYDPLLAVHLLALDGRSDPTLLGHAKRVLAKGGVAPDVFTVLQIIHDGHANGLTGALALEDKIEIFDIALANPRRGIDDRDAAALHARRAELLVEAGRTGAAIESLRSATRLAPDDIETGTRLAEGLAKAGRDAEAAAELGRLAPLLPGADHSIRGRLDALLGRLDRSGHAVTRTAEGP